jgi:hypothetical protein
VDAEQCTAFISNYGQERSTLYLTLSEMVDGISRSLCSPENLTAQLIHYASLPISERNKHANIFVTAICRSEDQPHANVLHRMLVRELEYSKRGVSVPLNPPYTLKHFLISKHLDTKVEEYVNGCECYNSTFSCSRCKVQSK